MIRRVLAKKVPTKRLFLFNLVMDESDFVLAAASDWAYEFTKHFDNVYVFSTRVGKYKPKNNLKVIETGGGGLLKRVWAICKILWWCKILKPNRTDLAFHHMSTKTLIVPGLIFKALRVPQGIWYSHSKADKFLKLGIYLSPTIFSPTSSSFPLKKNNLKVNVVGHGIKIQKEVSEGEFLGTRNIDVLFVGRIARIKKIEQMITCIASVNELSSGLPMRGVIVGPVTDKDYLRELQNLANKLSVNIEFRAPVDRLKLGQTYLDADVLFSNTPNSTDKVAIEAAMLGCFVISTESETIKICGMSDTLGAWVNSLESQLKFIRQMSPIEKTKLRWTMSQMVQGANNLEGFIDNLVRILNAK